LTQKKAPRTSVTGNHIFSLTYLILYTMIWTQFPLMSPLSSYVPKTGSVMNLRGLGGS